MAGCLCWTAATIFLPKLIWLLNIWQISDFDGVIKAYIAVPTTRYFYLITFLSAVGFFGGGIISSIYLISIPRLTRPKLVELWLIRIISFNIIFLTIVAIFRIFAQGFFEALGENDAVFNAFFVAPPLSSYLINVSGCLIILLIFAVIKKINNRKNITEKGKLFINRPLWMYQIFEYE